MEEYEEDEYSDDFEDESGVHETSKPPSFVTKEHSVTPEKPGTKAAPIESKSTTKKSRATRVSLTQKRKGMT